jgi:hypothetical protein
MQPAVDWAWYVHHQVAVTTTVHATRKRAPAHSAVAGRFVWADAKVHD